MPYGGNGTCLLHHVCHTTEQRLSVNCFASEATADTHPRRPRIAYRTYASRRQGLSSTETSQHESDRTLSIGPSLAGSCPSRFLNNSMRRDRARYTYLIPLIHAWTTAIRVDIASGGVNFVGSGVVAVAPLADVCEEAAVCLGKILTIDLRTLSLIPANSAQFHSSVQARATSFDSLFTKLAWVASRSVMHAHLR